MIQTLLDDTTLNQLDSFQLLKLYMAHYGVTWSWLVPYNNNHDRFSKCDQKSEIE